MPFAAIRSMNSSYMQGGSNAKVFTRPAISRIGVSGQSAQMRLMRSHGSSRNSRTAFLMCDPESNSIATKPASFKFLAIGSIMPVDMRSAHRLWWPSRMVVSTKWMSVISRAYLSGRSRNSVCPNSTKSPLPTRMLSIVPAVSVLTLVNTFITSIRPTVPPTSTLVPTCT